MRNQQEGIAQTTTFRESIRGIGPNNTIKDGLKATVKAAEQEAKANRRTLFAAIDAVTIGTMVAIGVFCRRAGVKGGRWTGIAGSSVFLELAKAVKKTFTR